MAQDNLNFFDTIHMICFPFILSYSANGTTSLSLVTNTSQASSNVFKLDNNASRSSGLIFSSTMTALLTRVCLRVSNISKPCAVNCKRLTRLSQPADTRSAMPARTKRSAICVIALTDTLSSFVNSEIANGPSRSILQTRNCAIGSCVAGSFKSSVDIFLHTIRNSVVMSVACWYRFSLIILIFSSQTDS